MAVKITVSSPSYNKGAAPAKVPPGELYPISFDIGEEHKVWVSIPRPDKLHLIGELLPSHFGTKLDLAGIGPSLTAALASGKMGKVAHTQFTGDYYRQVQVELGGTGGYVFFELRKAPKKSDAAHELVIHCNPARLHQEGMFDLLDGLHKVGSLQFKVGAFLSTARISRLDVAIDIVGVAVPELLVTASKSGKQARYFGPDGALETSAIHRQQKSAPGQPSKSAKKKPLGDLLVMIYDKRRQLIGLGEAPPFGDAHMTRLEVSKRRFGNQKCLLISLAQLKNPFAEIKVGHVSTAGPKGSWEWLRYVEARRGGGPIRAAFVNNLSPAVGQDFAKRYANHPSDIVDPELAWSFWPAALDYTGLNYMIEAAEQLAPGVPFPDDLTL